MKFNKIVKKNWIDWQLKNNKGKNMKYCNKK